MSDLPTTYKRLTGLVFNNNAYFKITDFKMKGSDTLRFSFKASSACNVIGAYDGTSATTNYSIYVGNSSTTKYTRYDGNTYSSQIVFGTTYNVVMTSTGITGLVTDSTWTAQTFTSSNDLCIGTTSPTATSSKLVGTIYGTVIVNGRLNAIPVERVSDSVLGYYDTISGTFYTQTGSGVTSAGYDTSDSIADVTRVGKRISDFQYSPPYSGYSKVVINVDSDTSYSSGSSTGKTLEFDCYFGSSTMASNIKTAINGYAYQPYAASDALLDPSAELGDAIYVNGYYSILASQETQYDPLCAANISAPDGGELASEYPYLSPIVRKVNKAISDSAEALSTANDAQNDADTANALITGFQYTGSSVQINGANLMANTVTASTIQGGTVNLLNGNSNTAGTLGITGASSADYKITISSNGAVAISAAAGSIALNTSSGAVELLSTGYFVVGADGIRPSANGSQMNGTSSYRWKEIWCTQSSLNSTSDRNDKTDISYDLTEYDALFDKIKPVTYKFIDGTSGRTHIGMIAQDIEESLGECGMTGQDFAGFLKDETETGTLYGLRYSEFIGLMIAEIQALKARVAELENTNG